FSEFQFVHGFKHVRPPPRVPRTFLVVENQYAVIIHGQKPFDSSSPHASIGGNGVECVWKPGPYTAELSIRPQGKPAPGHSPMRIGGFLWLEPSTPSEPV